jgi:hypothetical protein
VILPAGAGSHWILNQQSAIQSAIDNQQFNQQSAIDNQQSN